MLPGLDIYHSPVLFLSALKSDSRFMKMVYCLCRKILWTSLNQQCRCLRKKYFDWTRPAIPKNVIQQSTFYYRFLSNVWSTVFLLKLLIAKHSNFSDILLSNKLIMCKHTPREHKASTFTLGFTWSLTLYFTFLNCYPNIPWLI